MITFNYNAAFLTECTITGSVICLFAMNATLNQDMSTQEERMAMIFNLLVYATALALIVGLTTPKPDEHAEEINDENNDEEEEGSSLVVNTEHEDRLSKGGQYPGDIPIDFIDPISHAIMVNPVKLITEDPSHQHTYDYNSYNYLMSEAGGRKCLITHKNIIGFKPDEVLKKKIATWVMQVILNKKDLSQRDFTEKTDENLIKCGYGGTLFSQTRPSEDITNQILPNTPSPSQGGF